MNFRCCYCNCVVVAVDISVLFVLIKSLRVSSDEQHPSKKSLEHRPFNKLSFYGFYSSDDWNFCVSVCLYILIRKNRQCDKMIVKLKSHWIKTINKPQFGINNLMLANICKHILVHSHRLYFFPLLLLSFFFSFGLFVGCLMFFFKSFFLSCA